MVICVETSLGEITDGWRNSSIICNELQWCTVVRNVTCAFLTVSLIFTPAYLSQDSLHWPAFQYLPVQKSKQSITSGASLFMLLILKCFLLIHLRAEGSQCNCLIFDFFLQACWINVELFNLQQKEPNIYSNYFTNLCEEAAFLVSSKCFCFDLALI